MRATLALVIPVNWKFKVTPKQLTSRSGLPTLLWPQLLVGGAAIIAIPIGVVQFHQSAYLPFGAFVANVLWATLVAIIAIRALRFASTRASQRRSDHRFNIPLIAKLDAGAGQQSQIVIADEVSSNGFSFCTAERSDVGERLSGTLALPGGSQTFSADIIHVQPLGREEASRVSVRFCWANRSAADALDSFLYGSTLQWDVNGWAEALRTPYAVRLMRRYLSKPLFKGRWRHAMLSAGQLGEVECIMREEGETFRVLSLKPFPSTTALKLIDNEQTTSVNLSLAGYRSYASGGGLLHMAVLYSGANPVLPGYHREPSWIRSEAA